jgi:cell pole-organizing protein PopZ
MSQVAKAQEPSMEEILASIRRIIADDDGNKPARAPEPAPAPPKPVAAAPPPPKPKPASPPPAPANSQDQVDAMLAELDVTPKPAPPKPAPPPAPPKPAVEPPPTDVLDLTEAMAAPPPKPAPSFRTIDAAADVVFTDRAPEPLPEPPAPLPVRQVEEPPPQFAPSPAPLPDRAIISSATAAAVDSAFNSLAHVVLGGNARTLEDLVKEMLRPMLKSWLDDNLPSMVERIVRAEIERVSRGR